MQIKNRNLFRITRFILTEFPLFLKFFAKARQPQKRLLIIKTDAIGDFILFRNFIEIVKTSVIFKDYRIDLAGNKLWQEIALKYDHSFVGDFFFINPDELYEAPWQTLKLGWRLFKNNYQTVLHPAYSRTFIADGIAGFTAAKQIIGFEGDAERIAIKYKVKTDKFYTQLLQTPESCRFEFEKSKLFFENVLKQTLIINGPFIATENRSRKGVVIFPGAGVSKRCWEVEKFRSLIGLIIRDTQHPIYIGGGQAEINAGNFLMQNLPAERVSNLTGKTSLNQLIELIGNAALVITNETSAVHIAVATQTKSICILGGGHFGRFAPYPEKMENPPLCIYEKMGCYNCNWSCIYKTMENEPFPCIAAISLETVWAETRRYL